jgi:hypothetical protein
MPFTYTTKGHHMSNDSRRTSKEGRSTKGTADVTGAVGVRPLPCLEVLQGLITNQTEALVLQRRLAALERVERDEFRLKRNIAAAVVAGSTWDDLFRKEGALRSLLDLHQADRRLAALNEYQLQLSEQHKQLPDGMLHSLHAKPEFQKQLCESRDSRTHFRPSSRNPSPTR